MTAPTITRHSRRGGSSRSRSRRCARCEPDYPLWRDFPYEYEHDRLAIDLINGSALLREWVDDPPRLRPISTRWRRPKRQRGAKNAQACCFTANDIGLTVRAARAPC